MAKAKQRRDLAHQLDAAIGEIKTLRAQNTTLTHELYTDELTGIANRRAFDKQFESLVKTAHASNEPLALLVADVDGLKRTNDELGHSKGDVLLRAVAKALLASSRQTDLTGRLGGDEFYVLLPGFCPMPSQTLADLVEHTVQRYKHSFNRSIASLALPDDIHVNVSFGIAALDQTETAAHFFKRVDKIAQYNKKRFYEKLAKKGVGFSDERL